MLPVVAISESVGEIAHLHLRAVQVSVGKITLLRNDSFDLFIENSDHFKNGNI